MTLLEALDNLPPKTKMALILVRQGRSYEQVGQRLDLSAQQVQDLVERAMEYLLEVVPEESGRPCPRAPIDVKTLQRVESPMRWRNKFAEGSE